MKKTQQFRNRWSQLVFLVVLARPAHLRAATFTSTQSGNWGATATWGGGGGVPGCGDSVVISSGTTVVEDQNECTGDLTVSGTLDMANKLRRTVSSNTTMPAPMG